MARENVSRVLHDWAGRSLVSLLAGYYRLENKAVLQLDNCHKHTEQKSCRTTVPNSLSTASMALSGRLSPRSSLPSIRSWRQTGEGERTSRQLSKAGHQAEGPAARSSAIRH